MIFRKQTKSMKTIPKEKQKTTESQIRRDLLKSLTSRRQALQILSPRWLLVVTEYVAWNVANYTVGNQSDQYYNVYYFGERLFVVLTFYALLKSVHKRYLWVIKTMLALAIFKLIYIICFIAKLIPLNKAQHISLLGFVFIGAIALIIFKWGKA